MKTLKKFGSISTASLFLLGLIVFAMPTANVYAQSPADEPLPPIVEVLPDEPIPPAGEGVREQNALERLFKLAKKVHENQQKLITQADKIGNRTAELIARAKENGKDTAELETALAGFNQKIGEARLKFDQTGRLIKQHAGFDDAGKAVDPVAAKATLEEIRNGGKEVRQIVGDALKGLRGAGKAFRDANPRPEPPVSPTADVPA